MLNNSMSSSGHIVLWALSFQDSRRHDFADCPAVFHHFQCFLWIPSHGPWHICFFFSLSFYWIPFFLFPILTPFFFHLTVCYIFLTFIQEFVFFWNYLQSFFKKCVWNFISLLLIAGVTVGLVIFEENLLPLLFMFILFLHWDLYIWDWVIDRIWSHLSSFSGCVYNVLESLSYTGTDVSFSSARPGSIPSALLMVITIWNISVNG